MVSMRDEKAFARIWTIPNVLSFFRLALIPVFLVLLVEGQDALALLTLVVSSLTDFIDGYVARRFRQITRLGELLDPAADRLYIFATLIGLAWRELIPWWIVIAIIGRDLMLGVLGIILAKHGMAPLKVHRLGKIATFVILFALPMTMLGQAFTGIAWISDPTGWVLAIIGAVLYWWAGLIYLQETIRVTRRRAVNTWNESDTLEH